MRRFLFISRLALAAALAAAFALPQAVNALMVAKGGQEATVHVLDQPAKPIRGDADKWRITALATVVALGIGCFLAVALDASLPRREFLADPAPH